jgi:TRAP-type mannitol/chloroaromatic compound transport system substrate-binding protein
MTDRRKFLAKASGGVAALATAAIADAPNVIAQPKIQWRMPTTFPAALDIQFGAAQRLAKAVDEMSGGRFRIEVFPAGQIMLAFDCFDAASEGKVEMFCGASLFWDEPVPRALANAREPAFQWFTTVPFGMNPEGMTAWFHQGDGLKLWEEAYAAFNLVPRPGALTAPEMGGWYRKKIATIGDYKGLKMRIPGLGGKVVARAGATVVTLPPSDIYAALERGVIDTSEYISPHDDMTLGLHKTARYYYYPGWHQPGTTNEFVFNKKAYEALPVDLRRMLDHAAAAVQVYSLATFHAKNAIALERLKTEFKGKVEILQFPAPMLRELKKFAAEVVKEESEKTPMAKKVHASFTKFQALLSPWDRVAEGAYHQFVAG